MERLHRDLVDVTDEVAQHGQSVRERERRQNASDDCNGPRRGTLTLAAIEKPQEQDARVALRMAIVLSPHRGGTFGILYHLARLGLGGSIAGGAQYVSWIHDQDLVRAVVFLLERDDFEGVVNLAAPEPLPQREFMRALRAAVHMPFGMPGTKWMFEVAAVLHRTDTELLLKSRRVVPGRLLDAGFGFDFPSWPDAARDLVARWKCEPL